GLIVQVPRRALAAVLHVLPRDLPAVVTDGPEDLSFSTVTTDSVAGACMAVEHLLSLGHETVHFVRGASDFHASQMREDGWRQTLKRHKRRTPRPLRGDWSAESGYAAGQRLAADPAVTAVFVANDQMALGAVHAFHDAGIPVPERVSIVGFDGIPEAAHFIPPLTTIEQNFEAFGGASIAALLSQLGPLRAQAPAHHLIPPRLIVRQSTARVSR
ncbi:MAG: substrate-binding domain-containing protein, partial [Actinomycetota bacterium]